MQMRCPYMEGRGGILKGNAHIWRRNKYMQMRVIIEGIKPPTTIYGKDMLIYANEHDYRWN